MRFDLDKKSKILGDRYYLHHLIAQSNHSKIFLATDLRINYRKCAIKQFYPSYCPLQMQCKFESAFLQEVRILKELAGKHEGICQFYSYFFDSGNQYLVQEWIEGTTLEQKLLQQPKLSELETKSILSNLLLVLERIHNLGIIHNDIKPSNIILRNSPVYESVAQLPMPLTSNNFPVLIDFGIARKINTDYRQKVVAGTPGYMSLEQAMGKATFNNDLYSLALTTIHLLTGRSPQLIDFNSQQDNFWHQAKTAFDPKLVTVIDRAITPQAERRFTSAMEMLAMLNCSEKRAISTVTNLSQAKLKLGDLSLIIVLAVSGMWLYLDYLMPQLNNKPPINITDSGRNEFSTPTPTKDKPKPTILETTNNALQDKIFVPGSSQSIVLQTLGEPLWRKPGFWANSIGWSYENIVAQGIDLGYIFDSQTHKLRQVEIAVPPSTDLSTIQSALNSFLVTESLPLDLERGLQAVYQREKNIYNFTAGNLEGIIQRNHYDRIYVAVWSADFH